MHHFCSSYPVFFSILCVLIAATVAASFIAAIASYAGSQQMRMDYSRVREWNAAARYIRRAWLPLGIGIILSAAACMLTAHDRIIGIAVFVIFAPTGVGLVFLGDRLTPLERYERYG